ncbi:MAG: rod shape-determining protein MreC [Flavobacteriales bacterium]
MGLLFLVLQALCFFLLFQQNNFHKTIYINSSNKVVSELYAKRNKLADYLRLDEINDTLAWENAQLKNRDSHSFVALQNDLVMIDDTILRRKYLYTSAKVINNSVNKKSNYITLNKGIKHGISEGMAVVSLDKAVGIVRHVSDHFSVVLPLVNTKFQPSVKHKKSGEIGVFNWPGDQPDIAKVRDFAKYTVLQKGDSIVTTGYSAYFPEGILIGTVSEIKNDPGDDFIQVMIDLGIEFDRLNYVNVVQNLMLDEREALEAQVPNEE